MVDLAASDESELAPVITGRGPRIAESACTPSSVTVEERGRGRVVPRVRTPVSLEEVTGSCNVIVALVRERGRRGPEAVALLGRSRSGRYGVR